MSGVLYFDDTKPVVGAKLIILVDRVNKPAGVWTGELITIRDDDDVVYPHSDFLRDTRWVYCTAKITDPQAPEEFAGQEPVINYRAYIATSGTHYFLKRLDDANIEIRGLKRRMEIERHSWHAMMKAIVNPDAFPKLQKLLEEFLTRLGR